MARQPFAPLDGVRLQALTNTKNRQNAVQPFASKRKAIAWNDSEDLENIAPHFSAKRTKCVDGSQSHRLSEKPACTPSRASPTSVADIFDAKPSPLLAATLTSSRAVLKPRAPSMKMFAKLSSSSPIRSSVKASPLPLPVSSTSSHSSLAGRSPTRSSRRGGLLSAKRRASPGLGNSTPASRSISSNFGAAAPFSLDAALKGTLSSYDARLTASALPMSSLLDETIGLDASWEFTIHEDTPEQDMTNLLQHSTCVLDISSDEESEQKARRERAEGRDKENIPPPNDISQTSSIHRQSSTTTATAAAYSSLEKMPIDRPRSPLSQLNAADYYAEGCDEASVVLVAFDETEEEEQRPQHQHQTRERPSLAALLHEEFSVQTAPEEPVSKTVEDVVADGEKSASSAALLEPIQGTDESFQLWESGSQKDGDL
ncbi:hypothetical protein SEPCBS57363_003998 [Sporothrix epigloea]|uniref:Thymidylate kinase n=1 Tax=Sporothrix epigloea TaxID=1892477 RepID=A0ABP0DTP6_9PEZI